jgi:hypothetical protein
MVNFADEETPAGAIDGLNAVFTLARAPNPAPSLQLFLSGIVKMQRTGHDYTLSGSTITFAVPPPAGSNLLAWYRY